MSNFGINSASVAISAASTNDIVIRSNPATGTVSANTVFGLEGNDVISIGTMGATGKAQAVLGAAFYSTGGAGTIVLSANLLGSAGSEVASTALTLTGDGSTTGTVEASAIVTSQRAARKLSVSQLWGNQGNDTIAIGGELTEISASTIGGGAGNDIIGSYEYFTAGGASVATVTTAGDYKGAFFEAGGGNDTILIDASVQALNFTAVTVQGGQGADTATVRTNGTLLNSLIAGGGGNDDINVTASAAVTSTTIAGGGGADHIAFGAGFASTQNNTILGDALNSVSEFDGNDTIVITAAEDALLSALTVQGAGGADSIALSFSAAGDIGSDILLHGGQGDDTIGIYTGVISAATIQGGAGADSIRIGSAATAGLFQAGGGSDTIQFGVNGLAAGLTGSTIYGGEGADLISASAAGNVDFVARYAFSAASDSTLSAMDTIAIGGGASTQMSFRYDASTLTRAGFTTAAAAGTALATATNGVVGFGADAAQSLTARVELLDGQLSENQFAIFNNSDNNRSYLFIQGGSTDLVAQIGTANSVSGATVTMGATNNAFSATFIAQ